jgi:hypothetical protein
MLKKYGPNHKTTIGCELQGTTYFLLMFKYD